MEKKVCTKCKEEKELTEFNIKVYQCKQCLRESQKEYYQNNKERILEGRKEYYQKNKDKVTEISKLYYQNNKERRSKYIKLYRENNKERISEYTKKYRNINKERISEYRENNKEISKLYRENNKERRRENHRYRNLFDPMYKLKNNIKSFIRSTLRTKGYSKKSNTYKILGCSYEDFKTHIESQWEEWMNWGNYGKYNGEENYGWDLDHIIPLSSGKCEEDIIKLNHYSNIQPLCSYINRYVKRDKII